MASSHDHQAQIGVPDDEQSITCDAFMSMDIDGPATPVNREAPRMNLPPGPKSGLPKKKEHQSPTKNSHGRLRGAKNDSADELLDTSMDISPFKMKPLKPWSETFGRELPKTPIRKVSAHRDKKVFRTTSPKKCPSVNRSRYQGRYYRVRSPATQRAESGATSPTNPTPLIQGALLNFNDVLENKEKKGQFL